MNWNVTTLGEVAEIDRQRVSPALVSPSTHYVGLEHIDSINGIRTTETVESAALRSTKFRFTASHILFGKLRPYLCKIARPTIEGICSTDILPILPGDNLDTGYLYYFLRQPNQVELATRRSSGANLPRLSPKELAKFEIPLPPIAEQKRIAGILDAADALRVKRRDAISHLDTLLQSTFLTLFGDPVTNSKGWTTVKLQEIGASRLGKMLDKGKQTGDCQFPYLANFNVQWGRFELNTLRCMDFTEADRKEFELRNGDLLVCEGGEVGRTAIWRGEQEDIYFQKALHRIRLETTKSVPEYFQFYMWFMAKNGGFRDLTNSATIAHLTGVKLKKLLIPLPPIDFQRRFATIVESIEKQKAYQCAHLAELDTLFASLQSRAFNGEL